MVIQYYKEYPVPFIKKTDLLYIKLQHVVIFSLMRDQNFQCNQIILDEIITNEFLFYVNLLTMWMIQSFVLLFTIRSLFTAM